MSWSRFDLIVAGGVAAIEWEAARYEFLSSWGRTSEVTWRTDWSPAWTLWFFRWEFVPGVQGSVTFPLWLPLALAAIPSNLAWRSELRRRRRERIGKCSTCGYDLAGLAAGVACPECGTGKARVV
ncbi:MAG: hypothetical protein IT438_03055 [Phycisphaerales bacterium]|nr:hypothetical protein [Phycisphaerales bacterium]